MKGNMLSRRYATALADVVQESSELERVRDELAALAAALQQSRPFQVVVRTAGKGRSGKKALFGNLCKRLNLSAHTARLLDYLVDKKRTAVLPELAESFARESDQRLCICQAHLTTAFPLTEQQRQQITQGLEKAMQARIELRERIDPSLIAGFHVTLDGKSFDGSLRGRLERIRETMAHGE
jgi:F-type H+-transporting ATPase subunit delta